MNNSLKSLFIFCLLTICLMPLSAQEKLQPKALIIMIDGMRADVYENVPMPNLEKLRASKWQPGYQGAWSLYANTLRDGTTESAPNHVAIATGMTVKKTGVDDNGDLVRRGTTTEKLPTWRHLAKNCFLVIPLFLLIGLVSTEDEKAAIFDDLIGHL